MSKEQGDTEIEMFIEGIRYDLIQKSPVVILRNQEGSRFLPIWIGGQEGAAIQLALDEQTTPRPMTHDLLCNILEATGQSVDRVSIHSIVDKVFHASILLVSGEGSASTIDSRPSDAIAVAVRVKSPIYVAQEVLDESAMDKVTMGDGNEAEEAEEREKFQDFLRDLKPSDFEQ